MPYNRRTALVTVALTLSLLATGAAGQSRTPGQYAKVDEFVTFPLGLHGEQSLEDLRKLGKVLRETSRLSPNVYQAGTQNDSRTLFYDGLVLHVVFVGSDLNRGLLWKTDITKPRWVMAHGLKVGASVEEIQAVLGEPYERAPGRIKYCGDRACGIFYLKTGRMTRAVFSNTPE